MIRRSLILDTLVDQVVRTALVFSLFLLFAGHNHPGGGFVAGLVAGIALILKFVAGGRSAVASVLRSSPASIIGIGLGFALLTGAGGWVWGAGFLESTSWEIDLPVLGLLKATTALPFDLGVFVVVVGLTAALLMSLGDDGDSESGES